MEQAGVDRDGHGGGRLLDTGEDEVVRVVVGQVAGASQGDRGKARIVEMTPSALRAVTTSSGGSVCSDTVSEL